MQRYHDPRIDPLPQRSAHLENEAARIEQATQAFLANGGKIEQIGYQMSDAPAVFVINAEKTPVYAHLFQAPAPTVVADEPQAEPVPDTASDLETKQAAQIHFGSPGRAAEVDRQAVAYDRKARAPTGPRLPH